MRFKLFIPWLGVILTGLLGFLIFPTVLFGFEFPDLGLLAWIYLVPLTVGLYQLNHEGRCPLSFKVILGLPFFSGVIGHYGLLYWLFIAMKSFGGMHWLQAFVVLTTQVVVFSLIFSLFLSMSLWVHFRTRIGLWLALPTFMLLRDWTIHYFPFGGFPWGTVPYSQGPWLSFFQWVDITGPYGLALLIYLVNGLIYDAILVGLAERRYSRRGTFKLASILILFLISFLSSEFSSSRYLSQRESQGSLRLALIQANIHQDRKWRREHARGIVEGYLSMTREAHRAGAQLVLWPETAHPYGFREEEIHETRFLDGALNSIPLILGIYIRRGPPEEKKGFNAVTFIDPTGSLSQFYYKMHLVPFGEYMPFRKYLGFMEGLTQGIGYFIPGTDFTLIQVGAISFGSLICIEDVFPRYAREFSKRGADVLVNYTNDAWYGDTSAQHQHLAYSQFRALENRRPMVRATNTGITAVINPSGEVIDTLPPFEQGTLIHDLDLHQGRSFYTVHGDGWMVGVLVIGVLLLVYSWGQVRKNKDILN